MCVGFFFPVVGFVQGVWREGLTCDGCPCGVLLESLNRVVGR